MTDHFQRQFAPGWEGVFRSRKIGPFSMSVQAGRDHRGSSPRIDLDDIRSYDTVAVTLNTKDGMMEVQRYGFPPDVRKLFPREGGGMALNVPQAALSLIEDHLRSLANAPAPSVAADEATRDAVNLTDTGLREILLKLNEALIGETGGVNPDLVRGMSDLMESARSRGIDLDGMEHVEDLAPAAPTP